MAGVAVPDGWHTSDRNLVSLFSFRGGAYAWRQHRGAYGSMGATVSRVRSEWMPANGLEIDAERPVVTIYYDDPRVVPRESQIADICVPVNALSLSRSRAAVA
jgi:DNA gyrase inhibitor GyrI